MANQQKLSAKSVQRSTSSAQLGPSRPRAAGLVHLVCMETTTHPEAGLGPVRTLSQLATQLGVTVQTLYDLRSPGRDPRGFSVGRELRFRVSEIDAWLAQLESDDAERHSRQAG